MKLEVMKKTIAFGLGMVMVLGVMAQELPQFNTVVTQEGDLYTRSVYSADGMLLSQGSFLQGEQHGQWLAFDDSGSELASGFYKNGLREGKWVIRSRDGFRTYEVQYKNNKVVEYTIRDVSPALVANP
jgi:antitoxin component YwqK of YwqJK toxin-antitoxin module